MILFDPIGVGLETWSPGTRMQGIAMRLGTLVIGLEENAVLIDEIGQIFFFGGGGGTFVWQPRQRQTPRGAPHHLREAHRGGPRRADLHWTGRQGLRHLQLSLSTDVKLEVCTAPQPPRPTAAAVHSRSQT